MYDGRELADDKATLAAIRKGDAKGGELVCRASRTVAKFKEEMLEVFGIKVQVAPPDDWVLALDGITLANLKNIKKNATKADMEELVAYKRAEKTSIKIQEEEDEPAKVSGMSLSEEEIKRLESFSYTFTPDCNIEPICLADPNDEGYWEAVTMAWTILSDIENGEPVRCWRGDLSCRKNAIDGAYLHYESDDHVDFMVIVVDCEIICVITEENAEEAQEIVWG